MIDQGKFGTGSVFQQQVSQTGWSLGGRLGDNSDIHNCRLPPVYCCHTSHNHTCLYTLLLTIHCISVYV